MKCINCETDNKLKDRTANNGRCKNCGHQFVFEPRSMKSERTLNFSDQFFAKTISKISAEDTLFFTTKQLLYALARGYGERLNKSSKSGLGCPIAFFSFVLIFLLLLLIVSEGSGSNEPALRVFLGLFISVVIFLLFAFLNQIFGRNRSVPYAISALEKTSLEKVINWVNNWIEVNEKIEKLLPKPSSESTSIEINKDVSAYSFDRLIVCDRDEIAQFLIANNFHFENNCAIVSITGYPQNIFNTIMEMVRRNPDLKVYALHDATPDGIKLVHTLRTNPDWFSNSNVVIYDLGLLPRQIFKSRNLFVRKSENYEGMVKQIPETIKKKLSNKELYWLDTGNFIELESFTPKKLIKVVTQGIATSQTIDLGDRLDYIYIDSTTDYGLTLDSFG